MNISQQIHSPEDASQGRCSENEPFVLFRVRGRLGNGVKSRIKSYGCQWNHVSHGWLCPFVQQTVVGNALKEARVQYDECKLLLPKGLIPLDPKIAGLQLRLEILEEEVYHADKKLLEDIYRYDASLRPEDFRSIPPTEGKSEIQIKIERDFYERELIIKEKSEEIAQISQELNHLDTDPGAKIVDANAPLKTAEALLQEYYTHNKQYRTLLYCSDAFLHWNGIHYAAVEDTELRQKIYMFLRDAKEVSKAGHLDSFNPTKNKVDQIVDALRAVCYVKHHPAQGAIWLDSRKEPDPKFVVAFQNGLLCLKSWLANPSTPLIEHTPLLLNVNSLEFEFNPNAPEPRAWLNFLDTIWENDLESQQVLQEWFGYVLTQDTRQHKILLIIGSPRSGKGTIGRVLRDLLGHFNVAGPTLSSLSGDFGLQPLLNQMLALISDARLNGKMNNSIIIERLLSISGEDPLTINRKFLSPITVQLSTRIMMMSNELPDMKDPSGAIAKRYLLLTLKKSWLGQEDISLLARLKPDLPGILLWALQGLARLEERGYFLQPSSSSQTVEELEAMTSPIKAFISERCVVSPNVRIAVTDLFEAWRDWCTCTGYQYPGNAQSFGKNLRAAFPDIEITRPQEGLTRERYYKGIELV